MFSFLQVGTPLVWPLVWLALVIIVLFNPVPARSHYLCLQFELTHFENV
jgi:hypothetical protein